MKIRWRGLKKASTHIQKHIKASKQAQLVERSGNWAKMRRTKNVETWLKNAFRNTLHLTRKRKRKCSITNTNQIENLVSRNRKQNSIKWKRDEIGWDSTAQKKTWHIILYIIGRNNWMGFKKSKTYNKEFKSLEKHSYDLTLNWYRII